MAEITAGMVKELREKTDAPMMECKKALTEASGDMGKAEEILRVKLGNKASKAASRVAAEGVVAVYVTADGKLGSILEVNCETDFVAKNDDFLAFSSAAAALVAEKNPADVTALSALDLKGTPVEEARKALVQQLRDLALGRRAEVRDVFAARHDAALDHSPLYQRVGDREPGEHAGARAREVEDQRPVEAESSPQP